MPLPLSARRWALSLVLVPAALGLGGAPAPDADEIRASRAEALRFAPAGARVLSATLGQLPNDGVVVCGVIDLSGEQLPFATIWDPDRPPERGATLVGLSASERRLRRRAEAYHASIRNVCARAGLAKGLPLR
ncbi:MAG: hypothetical protein AB1942_25595 [Pseudomonadota bacterium]